MNDSDLFGEELPLLKTQPLTTEISEAEFKKEYECSFVPEHVSEPIPDEEYPELTSEPIEGGFTKMPDNKLARDIQLVSEAGTAPIKQPVQTHSGDNIMAIIERVASNPDVDVAKLEKMIDLQERILNKEAEQAFAASMAACQAEMPSVFKAASNQQTRSTYAKFEDILSVCKPVTTKHGFAVSFGNAESSIANHIRITCEVSHSQGHSKHYFKDLPIDNSGMTGKVNKTMMHGMASSETYGKRYIFTGVFNIAVTDDDTDGNQPAVEIQVISGSQVSHLEMMIEKTDSDLKMFCSVCKVSELAQLPASKFDQALKLLQDKLAKMNSSK